MASQVSLRTKISLYYHTLRFVRASQILWRLRRVVLQAIFRYLPSVTERWYNGLAKRLQVRLASVQLLPGASDLGTLSPSDPELGQRLRRAEELMQGSFVFLNQTQVMKDGVDWQSPKVSLLWRFSLHSFDYSLDLGLLYRKGEPQAYQCFRELAQSWMKENPVGKGDGWHSFTISLRLVNWLYAWQLFQPELKEDRAFQEELSRSLALQALFLERNLEYDLLGNHLIKNGKALFLAGLFFEGEAPRRWFRRGLGILCRQMQEQVLPDGGHEECSPMYHNQVLSDYLEVAAALRLNGLAIPAELERGLKRMLAFTASMRHPDGAIPLFNDSTLSGAPAPSDLLALGSFLFPGSGHRNDGVPFSLYPLLFAGSSGRQRFEALPIVSSFKASEALPDSGYFILRGQGEAHMIIDGGLPCPDHQPGHAHADLLSYELSLGKERFIVDSGVNEYAAGSWRDFFRSTSAHNTVVVDGAEQSEVWASFRMARRARPLKAQLTSRDGLCWFAGSHDGYCRLPSPVIHQRRVFLFDNRLFFVVDDLRGRGLHRLESFLHFHPDCTLETASDVAPGALCARCGERALWVIPLDGWKMSLVSGATEPVRGWYAPEFGYKVPNQTVVLSAERELSVSLGYLLVPDQPCHIEFLESAARGIGRLGVIYEGNRYVLDLSAESLHILPRLKEALQPR